MSPIQKKTPVFLISFNRGHMLKKTISAINGLATPTDIIIHDNGSDDAETLRIIQYLEAQNITVFRRSPISAADELENVNETIDAYFSKKGYLSPYVVSDCDIDMSRADPSALDVFGVLLGLCPSAECVGPMLRIRDIPRDYPLFNRVMNRHIEQFWRHEPTFIETPLGQIAVLPSTIDTTFALHRAGERFKRLKTGLRVYEPFEARHLDWYLTEDFDNIYAETSNNKISHWNNNVELSQYKDSKLEYSSYTAVRRGPDHRLIAYIEHL